nr:hypothetical protein Iba_chr01dCG16390 [Ipomoea batatas]
MVPQRGQENPRTCRRLRATALLPQTMKKKQQLQGFLGSQSSEAACWTLRGRNASSRRKSHQLKPVQSPKLRPAGSSCSGEPSNVSIIRKNLRKGLVRNRINPHCRKLLLQLRVPQILHIIVCSPRKLLCYYSPPAPNRSMKLDNKLFFLGTKVIILFLTKINIMPRRTIIAPPSPATPLNSPSHS